MSKRITLSMNAEYQERLKILAETEDTPASRLIRRYIDEHFEEYVEEGNYNEDYYDDKPDDVPLLPPPRRRRPDRVCSHYGLPP